MTRAQFSAMALCTLIALLVFSSVMAIPCNNSTCVNGDCVNVADHAEAYECNCHANWYSDNCTVFICNHTGKYPCGSNGICYQVNSTDYGCSCDDQYSGDHCQISHLNCTNMSCNGHGSCSDNASLPSGYQCKCDTGFTGTFCETNIDDCEGVNCNNGSCVDGINDYACNCFTNYTGRHCDHPDYCAIHSAEQSNGCIDGVCCANNGTCYNNFTEERHECNCTPGWIPTFRCERPVKPCGGDPCQNGGTCEVNGIDYICHCFPSYTGQDCATQLTNCTNNTCLNNGTCIAEVTSELNVTREHCECPPYYTGELCQTHFDPCTNKCQNNGTCESSYIGDGEYSAICSCIEYFAGENCTEDINECSANNPCQNNATCINLHGSFTCICHDGFTGERCETNIDDCVNIMCLNNGTCEDLINDFACSCVPDYSGKFCQWHHRQTCNGTQNPCVLAHTVRCIDDYDGFGTNESNDGFQCACIDGFIGDQCEAKILHCENVSVCGGPQRRLNCTEGQGAKDYHCECKFGYAGNRCEIDLDLCENSPCHNGGTCEDYGNNYACTCLPGYTGQSCSVALCNNTDPSIICDESHTESCENGPTGPVCNCEVGYTGTRCETVFDPCDSNPCHSMATCNAHGNNYNCSCPPGYSGRDCTICSMPFCNCPVDDCSTKANNGICDEDCRRAECHWDTDECDAVYVPPDEPAVTPQDRWAECSATDDNGRSCRDLFDNGECNLPCTNADCLLDGTDCLPKNITCPDKEYCDDRYQDGWCNGMCNTAECQYDGGDCDLPNEVFASGLLVIIIALPAGETFSGQLKTMFLIALGDILNCIPIVAYEIPIAETPTRAERQAVINNNATISWNVTIKMDITHCEDICIDSASKASDIVNVHISRRNFPPEGFNYTVTGVYSLDNEEDNEEEESFPVLYAAIPIAVVLVLVIVGVVVGVKRKRASGTWHPNDKRNSRADGDRDTPSPLRRRSTMGDPVGQEETISLKSIRDEDVEFGDPMVLKKMHRGPKYAWADVEPPPGKKQDKKHCPRKEAQFIDQEPEDSRMWANLQYNDMRDYSRLKSALQLMEQKTHVDGRHRDINAKGPGGYTPLMMAVMQTSVAVMRGSLESKEEPMPEGAVANACVSIKDLIGMKADINAKNDRGQTTLHIATACCTSDALRQLIEVGSDINAQDADGWTPLHVAVGAAAHNVFRILLYCKGVNLDAQDNNGMTPLILASKDCAVTMAKQLLDRQAEPGVADARGKTALHWAASVNNVDGIRLLLQSNANKDIQDHKGQSPLYLAAREGHIEAVRLLLECFANRNIVDNMDRSPMMIAEERKHSAVARMLGEWNITALSHDGAVVQALAHAGHMSTSMASPSVVRRRQPGDSFFAHQMDTPHPNVPQPPCEMFCPPGSSNGHLKMEYPSPLGYQFNDHMNNQIPVGSNGPSTSIQPSASIHNQLNHHGPALHDANGHILPSMSMEGNCALQPHLMPPNYSPPGNATSLAVTRVNSSSSGSPASVLSPSNTSPLTHMDEPMAPVTSSYPTNTTIGQTSSYQRDSTGNESLGSDNNNSVLLENASYPTPPSALGCDAAYPCSPFTLANSNSVYLTPPPDPESSPERWLSSPGKGKSPNMNDITTVVKRPLANPVGMVSEPPPPYRPPCPSEMTYTLGGH